MCCCRGKRNQGWGGETSMLLFNEQRRVFVPCLSGYIHTRRSSTAAGKAGHATRTNVLNWNGSKLRPRTTTRRRRRKQIGKIKGKKYQTAIWWGRRKRRGGWTRSRRRVLCCVSTRLDSTRLDSTRTVNLRSLCRGWLPDWIAIVVDWVNGLMVDARYSLGVARSLARSVGRPGAALLLPKDNIVRIELNWIEEEEEAEEGGGGGGGDKRFVTFWRRSCCCIVQQWSSSSSSLNW